MDGEVHLTLWRRPEEHHRGRPIRRRELNFLPAQLRQSPAAVPAPHPPHLPVVQRRCDSAEHQHIARSHLTIQRAVLAVLHPRGRQPTYETHSPPQNPIRRPRRRDRKAEDPHLPRQHGQRLRPSDLPVVAALRLLHDAALPLGRVRAARRSQRREGAVQARQPALDALRAATPTGELLPTTRVRRAGQAIQHPRARHSGSLAGRLRRSLQPDRRGRTSTRLPPRPNTHSTQPAADKPRRAPPPAEPRTPVPDLMARSGSRRLAQARS